MKVLTVTLLTIINIVVQGQTIKRPVDFSPDNNFGLLITIGTKEEYAEWKYWLISDKKDTILMTSALTYDEFPPVTFWSKSSREIIFEDQTHENNNSKIKIYSLKDKKTEFETLGFIWGLGKNNFDQDRGLLFYFKRTDKTNETFDLMTLNIDSKEIKKLSSVTTSGDPLTGAPEIESIDKIKRQLTLTFEKKGYKQEKLKVGY
jgi:hypothetical protein